MATMWPYVLVLAALVAVGPVKGATQGPWWNNAVYYRILVDSFKDTNGDGLGDLRGEIYLIGFHQKYSNKLIFFNIMVREIDL